MKTKSLLSVFLLLLLTTLSAAMREISFYSPSPAKIPPVIDGKLDDPCWRDTAEYTASYEYFKSNPGGNSGTVSGSSTTAAGFISPSSIMNRM